MPSERFLHLPEEKKKRIIEAALKEFARVSYDEISINRIIQDADIPRGSFYQYFRDKQDLQIFLLEGFREQLKKKVEIYLEEERGDLFQFFQKALPEMVKVGMRYEFKDVCKNVFSQLRYGETCPGNEIFEKDGGWLFDILMKKMKDSYYEEYSKEDMVLIWEILIQLIKEAVVRIFLFEESEKETIEKYHKKLAIIKAGMKAEIKTEIKAEKRETQAKETKDV